MRGRIITEFTIKIPDWLEKPVILLVLLYRRLRYGYTFRRIPLTHGKYAIVDPDDYVWLSKYKWYVVNPVRPLSEDKHFFKIQRRLLQQADQKMAYYYPRKPQKKAPRLL